MTWVNEIINGMEKKIDSNNIGYKLLKTMGWKEGSSLGNKNEGLLEPIKIDIESKISKDPNKNYKGKKKSCKNKITLSNFKSKLYNTKEEKKNIDNIINDNLNKINFENVNNFNKEFYLEEEKELKKNISLLLNIIYNMYYMDKDKEYFELRNQILIENDEKEKNRNFAFDENLDKKYPINKNLSKFTEISEELQKLSNEENNFNEFSYYNIPNLIKFCMKFEEFLMGMHLKALTEEVMFYKINGFVENDIEYSKKFCELYFINMELIAKKIKFILSDKFFYCTTCSIKFDCKEDLSNHQEYDCGENDLSDY